MLASGGGRGLKDLERSGSFLFVVAGQDREGVAMGWLSGLGEGIGTRRRRKGWRPGRCGRAWRLAILDCRRG